MSLAQRIAKRERRKRTRARVRARRARSMEPRKFGSISSAVPVLNPEYREPTHLAELLVEFEAVRAWCRAREKWDADRTASEAPPRIKICGNTPPGHFKSSTLHTFIAVLLAEFPWLRIGYGTYNDDFAIENVTAIRKLCAPVEEAEEGDVVDDAPPTAGVAIGAIDRDGYFTTARGGCVMGFSLLAPPTGRRFHLVFVDDPYRSRQQAESVTERAKILRGVRSDLLSRQVAGGSCFIVIHTRWHVYDLTGELTKRKGKGAWKHVNLAAIKADGTPLAPDVWSMEMLEEVRAESEYEWMSLYMGDPRMPGGTIFDDSPALVDGFITSGAWSYVCGLDIARGEKQKNDPNAYAVTRRPAGPSTPLPTIDVLEWLEEAGPIADVDRWDEETRKRVQKPGFLRHLVRIAQTYPGIVFVMYVGRTETNMTGLMEAAAREAKTRIKIITFDAQGRTVWQRCEGGYSTAYSQGRVRLPRGPKTAALTTRHSTFTGGNAVDHALSALVSAYDWHAGKRPKGWSGDGSGQGRGTGEGSEAERMGRYV